MKKFIILFASLFVILTPAILTPTASYAYETEEDCPDCTGWMGNANGTTYEDYESCVNANDGFGCSGIGNNIIGGDEEGSEGEYGTYFCCGTDMGEYTDLEQCNEQCYDGWCNQGSSWDGACDSEDDPDYDTSDPCSQYLEEDGCDGREAYDSYGFKWSCVGDGTSGRCQKDSSMGCGGHDFEINCGYLTDFVAGVNLGRIYVDISDGGYSSSFLNLCDSDDIDCQTHMQDNACAYSETVRYFLSGNEGAKLIPYEVNMYANKTYGSSCYIPLPALLGNMENVCSYGDVVADQWYEGADCSSAIDDTWGFCYGLNETDDPECEEFISSHCDAIFAALDAEYASNGGDEDAARSAVRNYISNSCPTNTEKCNYLKGAFDYNNSDSCGSPCTSDGLEEVCSSFGAENSSAYNKCINTLSNTTECNAIANYIGEDCGMDTYNYYDLEGILDNIGTSCSFDTTRTDGYNCVLLENFLLDNVSCWWDEEEGETICDADFGGYPSETERYLNKVLQDAIDSGRVDAYRNAVEDVRSEFDLYTDNTPLSDPKLMAYYLEKSANKLGISCKPLCDYEDLFYSIEGNGYTDNACNHRNIIERYSDPVTISRVLVNCDKYNNLYDNDWYDNNNVAEYLGCHNGERIDDIVDDDCEFAEAWYDYVASQDREALDMSTEYCNLDAICGSLYESDTADYYRCKYNLGFTVYPGYNTDFEPRCENYWYDDMGQSQDTTLENFRTQLGLTCTDTCTGLGKYLKRGQCYDCKLPTSKHTEFFAGYEAGTKNCAHTYNTIVDKGLKIHDLKCELADDMTNWKCTVNALECGGGYYNPNIDKLGLRVGDMDEYYDDVLGFDSQGRPYVESSWGDCDKWIYGEDYDICARAVDFVYAYDPWSQCGEPDYTDENEVYPCTLPISARAIDMLACDTPVPAGYYGFDNFMQDYFYFNTKLACSKGYYQDKTGQTSCERCPQYNIKSTNGTTVFGTTSSTASTSASACYIDSINYFRGKHGKYHFTPQCNYD